MKTFIPNELASAVPGGFVTATDLIYEDNGELKVSLKDINSLILGNSNIDLLVQKYQALSEQLNSESNLDTLLFNKANAVDVYTKDQLYTKDEINRVLGLEHSPIADDIIQGKLQDNTFYIEGLVDCIEGTDYVEIGGVKWSTKNLGANSPADLGLLFAWGETIGYPEVDNDNPEKWFTWIDLDYGWGSPGDFSKYNKTDNKTTLDLEDDAAHVMLGNGWRIPTPEELESLSLSTSKIYIDSSIPHTPYGASGWELSAGNNIKIFFPLTKVSYLGLDLYGRSGLSGSFSDFPLTYSLYWSNTLGIDLENNCSNAAVFILDCDHGYAAAQIGTKIKSAPTFDAPIENSRRCMGCPIRPVWAGDGTPKKEGYIAITPYLNKLYIDTLTDNVYYWNGTMFKLLNTPLSIGTTTGTAADGGIVANLLERVTHLESLHSENPNPSTNP